MVGVAFAIEDGPATYLPVGHYSGENLDEMAVYRYLHDQSKVFRGELVGANLQYDMDYLAQMGVEFYDAMWRDVQIAEPLAGRAAAVLFPGQHCRPPRHPRQGRDPVAPVGRMPGC